jgi:hypothetical protein
MRRCVSIVGLLTVSVGLTSSALAQAAPGPEEAVQALRAELLALRRDYEERLAALEARLAALQAAGAATPPAAALASGKVFNPDTAVVGNFLGTAGRTPGSGEPSLELAEAEASFQAIVDPYARADVFLTFGPEELGIEEAYVTFPTLPGGLLGKAGRMRDAFGKVNSLHTHNVPWADRPLVVGNLLGGDEGLSDSGLSLSRLIPNPWLFLEATAQVYRGRSEVFGSESRGDLAYVGHLRAYRDLGESANLDLGGSFASGPSALAAGATTRLWGADVTFRYRPLRRAIYTRLLGRAEVVWSRVRDGSVEHDALGVYAYGEYQFARRWHVGARYDYSERAAEELADRGGSLLLAFRPSEFTQLRAQYRHTRFGEGRRVNEVLFQLLFAIGAHGAHPF